MLKTIIAAPLSVPVSTPDHNPALAVVIGTVYAIGGWQACLWVNPALALLTLAGAAAWAEFLLVAAVRAVPVPRMGAVRRRMMANGVAP